MAAVATAIAADSEIPSIPGLAFRGRSRLKHILINPSAVECIGRFAFKECVNVEVLQFLPAPSNNSADATSVSQFAAIGFSAFDECGCLHSALGLDHVRLSLKNIGGSAFRGCVNLKCFDFSVLHKLQSIGSWAFSDASLVEVDLSKSKELIALDDGTFANCTAMQCVTLPPNLKSIGIYAFCRIVGNTRSTQSLLVPRDVEQIGLMAFRGWMSLETLTFESTKNLRTLLYAQVQFRHRDRLTDNQPFLDCNSLHTVHLGQTNNSISPLVWSHMIHEMLNDSGLFSKARIANKNRASIAYNFLRSKIHNYFMTRSAVRATLFGRNKKRGHS